MEEAVSLTLRKINLSRWSWRWSGTVPLDLGGHVGVSVAHKVDAGMARCPLRVIPFRTVAINEEEERRKTRDLRRVGTMSSSLQDDLFTPVAWQQGGNWSLGCGWGVSWEMSEKRDKLWRNCPAQIKHTDSERYRRGGQNIGRTSLWLYIE